MMTFSSRNVDDSSSVALFQFGGCEPQQSFRRRAAAASVRAERGCRRARQGANESFLEAGRGWTLGGSSLAGQPPPSQWIGAAAARHGLDNNCYRCGCYHHYHRYCCYCCYHYYCCYYRCGRQRAVESVGLCRRHCKDELHLYQVRIAVCFLFHLGSCRLDHIEMGLVDDRWIINLILFRC